jgi:hypothetical protein
LGAGGGAEQEHGRAETEEAEEVVAFHSR